MDFYQQDFERAKEKEGTVQREVRRGDIFWAPVVEVGKEGELFVGKNRPVIIVSNEKANLFSGWVTYVPITSQPKKLLPTHVNVSCNLIQGTALCEKVSTLTKEKLSSFCGELDEDSMEKINEALRVQLKLATRAKDCREEIITSPMHVKEEENRFNIQRALQIARLEAERDLYRGLYTDILQKTLGGVKVKYDKKYSGRTVGWEVAGRRR